MRGTPEFDLAVKNFLAACADLETKRIENQKIVDPTLTVYTDNVETAKAALLVKANK